LRSNLFHDDSFVIFVDCDSLHETIYYTAVWVELNLAFLVENCLLSFWTKLSEFLFVDVKLWRPWREDSFLQEMQGWVLLRLQCSRWSREENHNLRRLQKNHRERG
jgi:hypothetical protein